MENLQQSQVRDSCKIALPEGLKNLISDISREVLRTQPHNLYQFIANYLSAMLVARENLTMAAHICKDVCDSNCQPGLDVELRNIGLNDEDAAKAKKVILGYFERDKVKEQNLLVDLMKKTDIDEEQLPAVQRAVQKAFKRRKFGQTAHINISPSCDVGAASRAADHTVNLYLKFEPSTEQYHATNKVKERKRSPTEDSSEDIFKNIHYDGGIQDLYVSNNCKSYKNTESLTSLAGSFVPQSERKEHSVDNASEREHFFISYEDGNNQNSNNEIYEKQPEKRQVHINLSTVGNDYENEETMTVEVGQTKNETDQTIFLADDKKILDLIDEPLEIIDDEAIDADDESEITIDEEIEEGSAEDI